jgi:hypothetical protein
LMRRTTRREAMLPPLGDAGPQLGSVKLQRRYAAAMKPRSLPSA